MKKFHLIALLFFTVLFTGICRSLVEAESTSRIETPASFDEEVRLATGIASDSFANGKVAISGDTAVVSSVAGFHVYVRTGSTWAQQALLVPSDGMVVTVAPRPVAISGSTVVIGAQSATIGGNSGQGALYVFVRNGTIWTEQQRLTASDGASGDSLGTDVGISGEAIIASARSDDVGTNTDQGSAYIFVRQAGFWHEQAKLLASDAAASDRFGAGIAINGDTAVVVSRIIVPAPRRPVVYIFVRSGTSWSQQTMLSVCEPSDFDLCNFGSSIAIDQDTLAVGNSFLNVGPNTAAGSVYVFFRNDATWTQQQRITAADGLQDDNFGTSAAIQGDTLVTGASAIGARLGSVYVYSRTGQTWALSQPRIQKTSPNFNNFLGASISLDGNRFIFSAARDQGSAAAPIGAAYIHEQPAPVATPTPTPTPTITPTPTPSPSPTPPVTVSVSGRVTTPGGLGLRNAVVSLTNSQNVRQTATTSSFGVYSFANIAPGEMYVIGVISKRYRFAPLSTTINSNMTNVDFVGLE